MIITEQVDVNTIGTTVFEIYTPTFLRSTVNTSIEG